MMSTQLKCFLILTTTYEIWILLSNLNYKNQSQLLLMDYLHSILSLATDKLNALQLTFKQAVKAYLIRESCNFLSTM